MDRDENGRTGVRGFETYFLAEARTDQEARVSAAENAPGSEPAAPAREVSVAGYDPVQQQSSALFANEVQQALGSFHPGPDRGVRQAPLAVLSNARMPSVLIEIGFITNPEEERLMGRPEFHRQSAGAIARAIDRIFEAYP